MDEGKDKRYWIGFDLGGTKIQANVFDDKFNCVAKKRRRTRGKEDQPGGLDRIVETIRIALEDGHIAPEKVAGIGVGCAGPLDLEKGVLLEAPNLGWKDVPLRKAIEKAFSCPCVIANDVDAGVYGEYRFGAARGARCVVGIFPGTGIGGGCVYEGRILRGKTNSCLEIGHCQVVPEGARCGCGRRGCLETVASRVSISAAAAAAAFRGDAPHLLADAGTDLVEIKSAMLADAIKAGDKAVEKIVRDAARWLGVAVSTLVHLLAPNVVVMGGGLVEAMPDLILEECERTARDRVLPSFRQSFDIVVAKLADDATVTGAAALVYDEVAGARKA